MAHHQPAITLQDTLCQALKGLEQIAGTAYTYAFALDPRRGILIVRILA